MPHGEGHTIKNELLIKIKSADENSGFGITFSKLKS